MTEDLIVAAIKRYLKTIQGIFFWKTHGGKYGTGGIPDLICCYRGRFIAFEVKRPGNVPSKLQEATILQIQNAGGLAVAVWSVAEVKAVIEKLR